MDTLKEAKAGDTNMQVLVSQMYSCGYGVPPDSQLVSPLSYSADFVDFGGWFYLAERNQIDALEWCTFVSKAHSTTLYL
ncbi:hypothetical protein LINPERPRIM_LOCUS25847 [Linum perenne]